MQCFYTIIFDNAHYCYWKNRWLVWYPTNRQMSYISASNKLFYLRCFENAEKKKKKENKKRRRSWYTMRHKVSVDRHKPYVGVGSLKLKFCIEDVFFSKEKIKKRKEKSGSKSFIVSDRPTKRQVSVGRHPLCSISNKTTPGPSFFRILNCRRWQQQFWAEEVT